MTRISLLLLPFVFLLACKADPKITQTPVTWAPLDRPADEVIVRLPADPGRLHPLLYSNGSAAEVMYNIFLYPMDFAYDEQMLLQPQLAKAAPEIREVENPDGTTGVAYSFEILPDAKWDNGTPITGHDYVFSLKAIFNQEVAAQRFQEYLTFISDVLVDPDNAKKFTVFTKEKYIIGEAAVGNLTIMPAYHYDPDGLMQRIPLKDLLDLKKGAELAKSNPILKQFAEQFSDPRFSNDPAGVVGSGPYRLASYIPNEQIVLET